MKTNAPNSFIFDIAKEWRKIWCQREEVDLMDKIELGSIGHMLLTRETSEPVNFDVTEEVLKAEKGRVSNYLPNPEKHWGPKRAAAIVIPRDATERKKQKRRAEDQPLDQGEEEESASEHIEEEERPVPE